MEKQEQAKPVRGQNLLEWYEALISAALVLVLIFRFSSASFRWTAAPWCPHW